MTNYSEMTIVALRKLAKEARVKNWWNLSKADIITALTPVEAAADDVVLNVESVTVDFSTGEVTLKMICDGVNVTPRKARKMLRKAFGAKHSRWTFNADEVANIKKIIAA